MGSRSLGECKHILNVDIMLRSGQGHTRYIHRRIPPVPGPGPFLIKHRDGSEIEFGRGRVGERLGVGPLPELCRLRLAVARALMLPS
jgi:hypothetical protein